MMTCKCKVLSYSLTGEKPIELLPLLNKGSHFQHNDQLSKLVLHRK